MIEKRNLVLAFLLVGILLVISLSSAGYNRALPQSTIPGSFGAGGIGFGVGLISDEEICRQTGQDLIIQVAPFGCEPPVVRSDLLEEQNVEVYCQLVATKVNPLIDIKAIKTMNFVWGSQKPKEIIGTPQFFPAKAALGIRTKLNSPVLSNIGYLRIVIARQPNESAMPDFLQGNLTATIFYDVKNALGIGDVSYHLPELNDRDFEENFASYSFWDGRAYIRAEAIDEEGAQISIYSSVSRPVSAGPGQIDYERNKIATIRLKEGEESRKIYLPGLGFCLAGVQVKLKGLEAADTRAKIRVNADIFEVTSKEKFLENKCSVIKIDKKGVLEKVSLSCREDGGRNKKFELTLSPKINFSIDGEEKTFGVGDYLFDSGSSGKTRKFFYLGYVGSVNDQTKEENLRATLVEIPQKRKNLTEIEISAVTTVSEAYQFPDDTKLTLASFVTSAGKFLIQGAPREFLSFLVDGRSITFITTSEPKNIGGKDVRLIGFAGPVDKKIPEGTTLENYYENASTKFLFSII